MGGLELIAPPRRQLGYGQAVANQTGIGAVADVTGLTTGAFVVPVGPLWVECWIGSMLQNTSTGNGIFYITDGSNNEVARMWTPSVAAGAVFGPIILRRRLVSPVVTPGASLTLKLRAQAGAGTLDLRLGADTIPTTNGPGFITAYTE